MSPLLHATRSPIAKERMRSQQRNAKSQESLNIWHFLDWRNTPTEGFGTSPAQRFLGQRCKTRLPTQRSLLVPRYSTERDAKALQSQKTGISATMITVPRSSHQWVKGKLSTCVYLDSRHGARACVLDWCHGVLVGGNFGVTAGISSVNYIGHK